MFPFWTLVLWRRLNGRVRFPENSIFFFGSPARLFVTKSGSKKERRIKSAKFGDKKVSRENFIPVSAETTIDETFEEFNSNNVEINEEDDVSINDTVFEEEISQRLRSSEEESFDDDYNDDFDFTTNEQTESTNTKKCFTLAEELFLFYTMFNLSWSSMEYLLSLLSRHNVNVLNSVYKLKKNSASKCTYLILIPM
mgnify:CR=1 FL=1